jgi:hypothetical protein
MGRQVVESGMRGMMAYGSAISRSVSLMIRFGNAAILIYHSGTSFQGVIGGFGEAFVSHCAYPIGSGGGGVVGWLIA